MDECPASVYLRGGRIERLGANACGVWWPGVSGAHHVVWDALSVRRVGSRTCGRVLPPSAGVPPCRRSGAGSSEGLHNQCCWCPSGVALFVQVSSHVSVDHGPCLAPPVLRGLGCRFRVSLRGDGINVRGRRCRRQAGGAKNFDRYHPVTLRRQEKTPRPARMQIEGSWITSTQQRRCDGGSRRTVPRSAWPSRWMPTQQREPRRRCRPSRRCPG